MLSFSRKKVSNRTKELIDDITKRAIARIEERIEKKHNQELAELIEKIIETELKKI